MSVFVKRPRVLPMAVVLLVCLFVPACGKSKVSQANYDKVKEGMTQQEVEGVLGPGKKDESGDGSGVAAQVGVNIPGAERGGKGVDTFVWESGEKKIKVYIVNGKVTRKLKEGF